MVIVLLPDDLFVYLLHSCGLLTHLLQRNAQSFDFFTERLVLGLEAIILLLKIMQLLQQPTVRCVSNLLLDARQMQAAIVEGIVLRIRVLDQ
jgi:hypothetical protein